MRLFKTVYIYERESCLCVYFYVCVCVCVSFSLCIKITWWKPRVQGDAAEILPSVHFCEWIRKGGRERRREKVKEEGRDWRKKGIWEGKRAWRRVNERIHNRVCKGLRLWEWKYTWVTKWVIIFKSCESVWMTNVWTRDIDQVNE